MARRGGIARAAALLVGLTALSTVLGFVRDAVIAAVYGVGAALDAYLVAQGVMNLVLALIAGAMAKALVPPVSRAAAASEGTRANRTVQTALTVTVAVLLLGSAVMFVAAEPVIAVLAPGFDAVTARSAVELTRIVLLSVVFIAGTNIVTGAAQAHGRFFFTGLEGLVFNVVMIAAALWFGTRFGITALAVGFVVGSAARFAVQLPALRAARLRLRPRWAVHDADFREVLHLVPALLVSSAAVNVNTLVDRAVGSSQGEGVIAALNFGWRIVSLVDTLLVATVVAAVFPAFSAAGTPERRDELRGLVGRSMTMLLVLLAPAAALLVVAAESVVAVVLGRGDFGVAAVQMTAVAVVAYATSALCLGVRLLGTRACLAVGDRRTPVQVAVLTMVVNVVGDLTLGVAYGIPGLAASTSISLVVGAVLLVVLLRRRHDAVPMSRVVRATARVIIAAAVAGTVVALSGVVVWDPRDGLWLTAAQVALGGGLLLGIYVVLLALLRSTELWEVADVVRHRLLPRRGRSPV